MGSGQLRIHLHLHLIKQNQTLTTHNANRHFRVRFTLSLRRTTFVKTAVDTALVTAVDLMMAREKRICVFIIEL